MKKQDPIITAAQTAWGKFKKQKKCSVSESTKRAIKITKKWQELAKIKKSSVRREVLVVKNNSSPGGKIDIVCGSTAYEMKVSPNNVRHEFYKDVMKILVYNSCSKYKPIKCFVFLTPSKAVKTLTSSPLYDGVRQISKKLGLEEIQVIPVDSKL